MKKYMYIYRFVLYKCVLVRTFALRLVQMENVFRRNIIKHCLVTKFAYVEVSNQTPG